MRIAVMQARAVVGDVDANLATIERHAEQAAGRGADVLVTPELFVTGYAPARLHTVDPSQQARITTAQSTIAQRHGIAVLASHPEVETAPAAPHSHDATSEERAAARQYIAATLVGADGSVMVRYRKVNLFDEGEADAFSAGTDAPTSVELAGVRVGVVICFDVEYPEMTRAAALAGADVVLVPTALTTGFDEVADVLVRARALENGVAVAYANHVGVQDGLTFGGGSVIVGPDGGVIARAGDEESLILADVTASDVLTARARVPYLAKFRRDLYSTWQPTG